MHAYVASTRPPSGTEVCALSFSPRTIHPSVGGRIRFTLSKAGGLRIRIYRVRHRKLVRRATISGSGFSAGPHSIAFNGRIHGHTLGPGRFVAIAKGGAVGSPTRRAAFKIKRP
jgi:hypothetical protein